MNDNRTAIEDELEVLYDAYYEELEQYANHQQQTRLYSGKSEITEGDDTSDTGHENGNDLFDDDDDDYDDDDDGASRSDDQSDAASDDGDAPHFPVTYTANTSSCLDQFNFGSSLTVKGVLLFSCTLSLKEWRYSNCCTIYCRRNPDSCR